MNKINHIKIGGFSIVISGFFGGMPVNRHSEACDVIELLTEVKKF